MPIDELRARCPIRVVLNDGEVELQVLVDSGVAPIFTVLVPRGVERLWSARATPRRGVTREDGAAPGGSPKRSRLHRSPALAHAAPHRRAASQAEGELPLAPRPASRTLEWELGILFALVGALMLGDVLFS